ncbi:MAG: hypothetical protein WAK17_06220 [Candidatus Nitrosopolaris sp.]|jgi:hypothetical protein
MVGNRTESAAVCQSCKDQPADVSRRRGLLFGMLAKTSIPSSIKQSFSHELKNPSLAMQSVERLLIAIYGRDEEHLA